MFVWFSNVPAFIASGFREHLSTIPHLRTRRRRILFFGELLAIWSFPRLQSPLALVYFMVWAILRADRVGSCGLLHFAGRPFTQEYHSGRLILKIWNLVSVGATSLSAFQKSFNACSEALSMVVRVCLITSTCFMGKGMFLLLGRQLLVDVLGGGGI